jgi:hypothetical protein
VRAGNASVQASGQVAAHALRLGQALLALLALNALLTLVNPGPTAWPQLTPRVAPELCALLLWASSCVGWRGAIPLRALALVTTLLVAVRTLEVTSAALFGRPLHVYWDGRHLGQLLTMNATPRWQVVAGVAVLLLAVVALYALVRACWARVQPALTLRPVRRAAAGLGLGLLAAWIALPRWAPEWPPLFAGTIAPVIVRQAQLGHGLLQGQGDVSRLTASPAFDTPLAGLHKADVLLLFSESYGVSTLDDPQQAQALAGPRAALAQAISNSGRHVVSARVRSPTYAGGSWLAHAALLAGVDTQDPLDYELLLSTQRRTLVQHFGDHGWRTVSWMPGLQRPWPEGAFFGFASYVDADTMGYGGPALGPWRIPDQAASSCACSSAMAAPAASRAPRFIVFPTTGSHVPFRPIAPFVADWDRLASPAPYTTAELASALDEPGSLRNPVPGYVASIASTWQWLGAYLRERAPPALLTIVIGDHQAFAGVSGVGASWDVPVHLISADAALLQRLERLGFVPGLSPPGPAIGAMHALTPMLLDAFAGP